jgi:hypothetical protein
VDISAACEFNATSKLLRQPHGRTRHDNRDGPTFTQYTTQRCTCRTGSMQIRAARHKCNKFQVQPTIRLPNSVPYSFHPVSGSYSFLKLQHSTYCSINNSTNAKAETLTCALLRANRLVLREGRLCWEPRINYHHPDIITRKE